MVHGAVPTALSAWSISAATLCMRWLSYSIISPTSARKSNQYMMPSEECHSDRIKEIEGALLQSQYHSLYTGEGSCVMQFEADGSASNFFIQFEEWSVSDCDLSFKIFNGDQHTSPAKTLTCSDSNPEPFISSGKDVAVRLHKLRNSGYHFKIVITAFTNKLPCHGLTCTADDKCIAEGLRCDRVRNCLHGTDEIDCHYKVNTVGPTVIVGTGLVVTIVLLLVCVTSSTILTVVICRRRRRHTGSVIYRPAVTTMTVPPSEFAEAPPSAQPLKYGATTAPYNAHSSPGAQTPYYAQQASDFSLQTGQYMPPTHGESLQFLPPTHPGYVPP